jgi:hypothetical protein
VFDWSPTRRSRLIALASMMMGIAFLVSGGPQGPLHWLVFPMIVTNLAIPYAAHAKWSREQRRAERIANGYCSACGYDLTGNVSGVCPECGTKDPKSAAEFSN